MPPVYTCSHCDKSFHRNFNRKRHITNVHKITPPAVERTNEKFRCPICSDSVTLLGDFIKHCLVVHDIPIKEETLNFKNEHEFQSWKKEIERNSQTCFVRQNGWETKHPVCKIRELHCSRSGFFNSRIDDNKRKRQVKMKGSRKINGFCPCGIKIKFFGDGTVSVDYCSTHIGHEPDLAHIPLTREVRQSLATKMANKIPFDAILGDVRSTVNQQELDRLHILTKQDLYNIETEFKLHADTVRHSNNVICVDAWVEKEKMSPSNCVLLYKPQNETIYDEKYTKFKKDDFALGIMTEAQGEILNKYGDDCVCIDGTHGLNASDFEVVTLMVIDDTRQGFPCAFFICNRIDSDTISTFLSCIKERIGGIKPSVFMSDMAESFYNAWGLVMGPVEKRLYCTWHVDRAWQANLTKIKDKEKRTDAYKKVRTLLEETDKNAFLVMLPFIIESLQSDETTKEYGEYFATHYGRCYKRWAYCYRVNSGINTYMHLELMHHTIKYLFFNGKRLKKLDKSINALMRVVKQKWFDRLTILEKGKLSSKVKELQSRHKKSLEMNSDLIVKNVNDACWEMAASSGSQVYIVREVDRNCDCRIVCEPCSACLHKYSCTCIDASIKWNMCKHIHLLCKKLQSEETTAQSDVYLDNEMSMYIFQTDDGAVSAENVAIFEEVVTAETETFEEKKKKQQDNFQMLFDQ